MYVILNGPAFESRILFNVHTTKYYLYKYFILYLVKLNSDKLSNYYNYFKIYKFKSKENVPSEFAKNLCLTPQILDLKMTVINRKLIRIQFHL